MLDFTNRSFRDLMHEVMNVDIYAKYKDLPKAKILRRIIEEYENVTVGKLFLEIMRYIQEKNLITHKNKDIFRKYAVIGNRLIGKTIVVKPKILRNKKIILP